MTRKKKKKSPGSKAVVTLLFMGALGLAGLAAYVKYAPASEIPKDLRRPENAATQVPGVDDPKAQIVQVFSPKFEGTDLKLVSEKTQVPTGQDPIVFAINRYLRNAESTDPDARLVSVEIKDGVALLNFNSAFRGSHGAFDEWALLKGICATLAQFPKIDKAQFLIENQPIDTIGNVELTDPIPVRETAESSKPSEEPPQSTQG